MRIAPLSNQHTKYNLQVILLSLLTLVCIVSYIILTIDDYKNNKKLIEQAVEWQLRTNGTVGLSSRLTSPYKELAGPQLIEKDNINTLAIGSSTLLGIRKEIFPEDMKLYNYSFNKFSLRQIIGGAYYFVEENNNIKWIIVGLDFFFSDYFSNLNIIYNDPSKAKLQNIIPFKEKFYEAINLSRIRITLDNIWSNLFFNIEEYKCPENDGWGRDFGTVLNPGHCSGIRSDGSATFNYHRMSKLEWKNSLNEKRLSSYTTHFKETIGEFSSDYLTHFSNINKVLLERSGGLILIFPPLIPEAEKLILKNDSGNILKTHKKEMTRWSKANNIRFIDASMSEKYGCASEDFYDSHHALEFCFSKVFSEHFKNK